MCPGASRPLGANKERQGRRLSGPNASHTEGLPSEVRWGGAVGAQGVGECLLYPRNGWQGRGVGSSFFCRVRLGDRTAQVAGEGPRRENEGKKKKKEMKNQWLKYSVSRGVGWGCPGPAQEAPSPRGGASTRRLEFGRWLRFRGLGRAGNEAAGSEALLDLLGPFHVIGPGLLAGQALDEVFKASPEAYLLQRVVEPACGGRQGTSALNGRAAVEETKESRLCRGQEPQGVRRGQGTRADRGHGDLPSVGLGLLTRAFVPSFIRFLT